jgi:GNAT superfamily N-acetyltransferase
MEGVVDPPSSVRELTPASLSRAPLVLVAGEPPEGCVICTPGPGALRLGKLAVRPDRQGRGIARALIVAAGAEARAMGLPALELSTRVELAGNHAMFRRLGFVETGRTAHPGYDRPTSIAFRKALA